MLAEALQPLHLMQKASAASKHQLLCWAAPFSDARSLTVTRPLFLVTGSFSPQAPVTLSFSVLRLFLEISQPMVGQHSSCPVPSPKRNPWTSHPQGSSEHLAGVSLDPCISGFLPCPNSHLLSWTSWRYLQSEPLVPRSVLHISKGFLEEQSLMG